MVKYYVIFSNNNKSEPISSLEEHSEGLIASQVQVGEFYFLKVLICHMHQRPTSAYPESFHQGEYIREPVWIVPRWV